MEPKADSALEFTVSNCSSADRADQARLFNACFKKQVDARGLAWRYDVSPHGASVSFVSRPRGGEAVSGYACSPRRMVPFGDEAKMAPVGETGDVMTHPDWRKRGLFSALDRACMAETKRLGWPMVFGLPNRRSAHIFLELGWERVGTIRPWTCVLRADAAARAERAKEGRLTGWLTFRAARARDQAARKAAHLADAGLERRELSEFPREVLELSRAVERRFALCVRRDAESLRWRFLDNPARLHRAIGLFARDGGFLAYVVVQVPRPGEKGGYLVDVLARDDALSAQAVGVGIEALRALGASFVQATAIDGSWWQARLVEAGFVPPKPENHLTIILHPNEADHPLVKAGRDPSKWYFTDGDRDDETMG